MIWHIDENCFKDWSQSIYEYTFKLLCLFVYARSWLTKNSGPYHAKNKKKARLRHVKKKSRTKVIIRPPPIKSNGRSLKEKLNFLDLSLTSGHYEIRVCGGRGSSAKTYVVGSQRNLFHVKHCLNCYFIASCWCLAAWYVICDCSISWNYSLFRVRVMNEVILMLMQRWWCCLWLCIDVDVMFFFCFFFERYFPGMLSKTTSYGHR